jgi:hypothetical protein
VAPALVAGVPELVSVVPELVSVVPELVSVVPELVSVVPEPAAVVVEAVPGVAVLVAPVSVDPTVLVDPAVLVEPALAVAVSLAGSEATNPDASGSWMLASACWALPFALRARKLIASGAGITMPMPAARRSIRCASESDATLARSCSLRL